MGKRKVFLKLIALSVAFIVTASYSLYVSAEPENEFDNDISEQPSVQESEEEYSEISDEDESSEADEDSDYEDESSDDEDEASDDEDEDSDYDEDSEEEFSWEESSEISEYSYYEPSYYEESSYEYSVSDRNYEPSVYYYGPSLEEDDDDDEESENTQFYEEESREPSTTYQETSIDSSEMTSRDWEILKNRLDAQNGRKSSDNAIRDIKDSEGSQNDNIIYLMWGLVLIGMGLVIIGFIIYSTAYTKRKLNENLQTKYKKKGNKVKKS